MKAKRYIFELVAFLIVIVIGLSVASLVSADPALVIHAGEGMCMLPDLDGKIVVPNNPPRGAGVIIVTNSTGGRWNAICTGVLPASSKLPQRAVTVTQDDIPEMRCGVPGITPEPAQSWHINYTPSGQVQLVCHY
jgi:hypothetical protein